jgi:serine/threonine-protein kinase
VQAGEIIAGKFRVERVLGEGGMGVVVVARNLHLEQTVALKFLHAAIATDQEVVARLVREARASAQLRSEHVCRVIDVGALDSGAPYIVMELLEGKDLAELIGEARLAPAVAAEYVLQACVAIAEAHLAGIVHRDLKPSNLFVTARLDGSPLVKVLDFGIAKAPQMGDQRMTSTQAVMGTPGYMSPEQLRSSRDVDGRTDIWALGAILYEAVAGHAPFRGETITELALKTTMDPFEPIVAPPPYLAVVSRCLEKRPDQRYQTVAALAQDLAAIAGPRGASSLATIARLSRGSVPTLGHVVVESAADAPTVREGEPKRAARRDPTPRLPVPTEVMPPPAAPIVPARSNPPIVLGALAVVAIGGIGFGVWKLSQGGAASTTSTRDAFTSPSPSPSKSTSTSTLDAAVADTTLVRFWSRDGHDKAAQITLGLDGSTTPLPAARVRDANEATVHVLVGIDASHDLLGDGDDHGAFRGAENVLRELAHSHVAHASTAAVYTLGPTATRVYRGQLGAIPASALGSPEQYRTDATIDLAGGLHQMISDADTSTGHTLLVVIASGGTLADASVVNLTRELAASGIELRFLWVGSERVPDAVSLFAGKSLVQVGGGDRLPAAGLDLRDALGEESIVEFDVPTPAWQHARNVTFFTAAAPHPFATSGRTEFSD